MDNLSSDRRFESLLNLVEADQGEWREEEHDDNSLERAAMGLGPCVGDDGPSPTLVLSICLPPPINARGAMGNPRPIEDDARGAPTAVSLTALGPSVGDDANGPPTARGLTMLGPSVGDDGGLSDVRLKEDVQRVGTTVFGLPLYRFKYIGSDAGRRVARGGRLPSRRLRRAGNEHATGILTERIDAGQKGARYRPLFLSIDVN
jgi:hypothetical protein